jgi:hypothetical protein
MAATWLIDTDRPFEECFDVHKIMVFADGIRERGQSGIPKNFLSHQSGNHRVDHGRHYLLRHHVDLSLGGGYISGLADQQDHLIVRRVARLRDADE